MTFPAFCLPMERRSGSTLQWIVMPPRHNVHKHRNLRANAPERLHDEITADYTDMIYADTPQEVQKRRKAFLRKWRLRLGAVANSLERRGIASSP